jgi:hypothetical protein
MVPMVFAVNTSIHDGGIKVVVIIIVLMFGLTFSGYLRGYFRKAN